MAYVLQPTKATQREVRRVARERLDDAIERLDAVISGDDAEIETAVHEVRKRCKETRGLARLVRPSLDVDAFDRTVRAAANQLSAMRDAHALLATIDALQGSLQGSLPGSLHADVHVASVRDHQAALASAANAAIGAGDERITDARTLLGEARAMSQTWRLPRGAGPLREGLAATYRSGRRSLGRAEREPTDHRLHEWRKVVKYLWYQLRLVHDAAPSVIGPIVDQLDALAEALGDDHDLAVLVAQLDATPESFGPPATVDVVRRAARGQQAALRERAFRAGATIYAESDRAFGKRIERYWKLAVARGPEVVVGGIATLAETESSLQPALEPALEPASSPFERERKFLLDELPDGLDLSDTAEIRQGYLASNEQASVRIRDAGNCTLTVKAGAGAERVELEWPIDRSRFDAAWPFTARQRVAKTRHRVPLGDSVVEIDVFGDSLTGLIIAEVEFGSIAELEAFDPPPWFGRELTDDGRYTNASLALDGRPHDGHSPA